VIADADTGYGNGMNAIRTVREYERAALPGAPRGSGLSQRSRSSEDKVIAPVDDYIRQIAPR